jgi:hypothetical protein
MTALSPFSNSRTFPGHMYRSRQVRSLGRKRRRFLRANDRAADRVALPRQRSSTAVISLPYTHDMYPLANPVRVQQIGSSA